MSDPEVQVPATPEPPPAPETQATASTPGPGASGDSAAAPPANKEVAEFARHRAGLQSKARELRNGFAQLKAREKEIAERDAAREKEISELRARVEKWEKGNPLEHVADPSQTVRDFVEKTAPERRIDQLEKQLAKAAETIAKLEKAPEEWTKQAQLERQKAAEAQTSAALAEERRTFARTVRTRAADFPYLHAECNDAEIEALAADVQAYAKQNKRIVSFDDAARFLNDRIKRVHDERGERRKALAPPDGKSGSGTERRDQKTPPGSGRRASGPADKPPARRRLELTPEEEQEKDLASLRDAMAKDALARQSNGAGKAS